MDDYDSDAKGAAGFFSALSPIIEKLIRFLRKRSLKKKARESVSFALSAAEKLQSDLANLTDCGLGFIQIVEEAQVPTSPGTSFKLYSQLVKWLNASADLTLSLADLVDQAERLTHLEMFMSELKTLDKPLCEFINILAHSKKNDKLDFSELPTFIAVYMRREERIPNALDPRVNEIVEPLVKKATSVGEGIQPPHRAQIPQLKRAFQRIEEANKRLAPMSELTKAEMRRESAPWANLSLDLVDAGLSVGLKISPRKIQRELPPPPPPKELHRWARGSKHKH